MAALSYAMGLAEPMNIRVDSGVRPGPLERRRQDPEIASPDAMSLELERGKPLKNVGRVIAGTLGIPLPYNFRQAEAAAEQARIDYENENAMFNDMANTFLEQADSNAVNSTDPAEERIYRQYQASGLDAAKAFAAQDASPEQRAVAAAQLVKLSDEMRSVRNADANELLKFKRQFVSQEVTSMRERLESAYMASNDRLISMDSMAAQWEVLRADPRSAEAQAFLRSAVEATVNSSSSTLGSVASAAGGGLATFGADPRVKAAGIGLTALGAYLGKEGLILDGDRVMRQMLAVHDAVGTIEDEFLPQLQERLIDRTKESERLGIPGDSWATDRFDVATPNTERLREQLKSGAAPAAAKEYSAAERYERLAERARQRATR